MKKTIALLATAMIVSVGCNRNSNNVAKESNEEQTVPDTTVVEEATPTESGSVAFKVFKLLGAKAVTNNMGEPVDQAQIADFIKNFEEGETSTSDEDMTDMLDNNWIVANEDVYYGCHIYTLKHNDGKYSVIHKCVVTYEGSPSIVSTNYYILSGDKLTKTEQFMPEGVTAQDIVDEFDDWAYSIVDPEAKYDIHDMKNISYNFFCNEDQTQDIYIQMPFGIGGCFLDWDGEKLTKSDRHFTRNYVFGEDESFVGFEFDSPAPELPEMEHYFLIFEGSNNAFLRKDDKALIHFEYENDELKKFTYLTDDFCDTPGLVVGGEE